MSPRSAILKRVLRDRRVRSLELAYTGFNMAEYGVWVAVLVYAYQRGGVDVTAMVAVAQLLPSAVMAPVLARSVDRWGALAALRAGYWTQSVALVAAGGLVLVDASSAAVYAAAIIAAIAVTMTRPAQAGLVPALASAPGELTAINVLSSWAESLSILVGPALTGVLIGVDGPGAAIAAFAICSLTAALLVADLGSSRRDGRLIGDRAIHPVTDPATGAAAGPERARFGGLLAVLGAQYLVVGMLDVLLVAFAISVLRLGASGAGYLNAALGAGGLGGSLAAVTLIGRRELVRPLLAAAVLWAALLAMLGAWPTVLNAFLLLAAAGMSRSLLDVSGRTILLHGAPPLMRARLFGMLEGLAMLALALGALLVPVLVELGSVRAALMAAAALLAGITLAALARPTGLIGLSATPATHAPAPAVNAPAPVAGGGGGAPAL